MTTPLTLSEITFGNLLKRGWAIFKENFVFLAGSFLAILVVQMLMSSLIGETGQNSEGAASLLYLATQIAAQIIAIGWFNVMIRATRNQPLEVSNFFDKVRVFLKYILAQLLVSVLVFFGLVLLIIPGIYLALKYMFVPYIIVDKETGVFESLTMSGKLTKGIKLKLVLYGLGFVGLNILGVLALGIGLAITAPVTTLAYAVLYNALLEKVDGTTQPTGEAAPASAAPAAPTTKAELQATDQTMLEGQDNSGAPPQSL